MNYFDSDKEIKQQYLTYIDQKDFACIAAKAALGRKQIHCMVADSMQCSKDDAAILRFLYDFIEEYRHSSEQYHSAAVIFKHPIVHDELVFEKLFWEKLQALSNIDALHYSYDRRVGNDPASPDFSFSLKQEAFFIVGLHPASSRATRQFQYPTVVFNPHMQFEELRDLGKYEAMKKTIRKRDKAYSGTVNPMLNDFGDVSEVYQYSGRQYGTGWKCPLNIKHASVKDHTTA